MFSSVKSCAFSGLGIEMISVECDVSRGVPALNIVGLPDTAVKESRERLRAAIMNSGMAFPGNKRIIINLSPAGNKKEGTQLDLAMAMSLMASANKVNYRIADDVAIIGELSLEGKALPILKALPLCLEIKRQGITNIVLPRSNLEDVDFIDGLTFFPVSSLVEAFDFLTDRIGIEPIMGKRQIATVSPEQFKWDFSEVKGRDEAKRGIEISVSGFHNMLFTGPPGCGKSMLAKRINTVLPPMSYQEMLEVTRIYSLAGQQPKEGRLIYSRPFRSPAGNTSMAAMIGGGNGFPKPGEISLAHFGTLFLDEIPEFRRDVLEALRQPLEDEEITISRIGGSITYPSKFMLVGARNPCPCGYYNDTEHKCTCTPLQIKRYQERLSGPIMDRFDLFVEMAAEDYTASADDTALEKPVTASGYKSSAQMRTTIEAARGMQEERYKNEKLFYNSQLSGKLLKRYCGLGKDARELYIQGYKSLKLSPRAGDKILKVARTIADMEGRDSIEAQHIAEALQFRSRSVSN